MSLIELAGGPVSWGVDFADHAGNPPYATVLRGIRAAGLDRLELGPVGYLPTGARARAVLDAHGLRAVGTFVFDDFHRPDAAPAVLGAVDAAVDAIAATGGTRLVLIDRPSPARAATAGRSAAAPRLDRHAWTPMIDTLRRAGERAAAAGLRPTLHPHAGGYLEFTDELDRLLDAVPASELGLCLDTGHALYAGADPAELLIRYGPRIEHLHLKDLDETVRDRGLAFWPAIAAGIFCPIGTGRLDLETLRAALAAIGYTGPATVEQDRVPGSGGDPAAALRSSVRRLRAAGIG